jgi:hypothetical protein
LARIREDKKGLFGFLSFSALLHSRILKTVMDLP